MANIERPIWSADGQTLSNVLVDNKSATYNITSTWYDGTPMDDSKLDNDLVYVKYDGEYLVRNLEEGQVLQKDTMNDMRNLSTLETLLLKMGIYKHVQLNGYYEKGDTPEPINYHLSETSRNDNGGSVVDVQSGIKLEHDFNGVVNIKYFGAKGDNVFNDTNSFKNCINYSLDSYIYVPRGEYILTETIYFPKNWQSVLRGEGKSARGNDRWSNGLVKIEWRGDESYTEVFKVEAESETDRFDGVFENIFIRNGTENDDIDGFVIERRYTNGNFTNIYISGFRDNLVLKNFFFYTIFENCRFANSKRHGVHIISEGFASLANGAMFLNCSFSKNNESGFYGDNIGEIINFTNCYIEQNGEYGLYINNCKVINIENSYIEFNGEKEGGTVGSRGSVKVTTSGGDNRFSNKSVTLNMKGNFIFERGEDLGLTRLEAVGNEFIELNLHGNTFFANQLNNSVLVSVPNIEISSRIGIDILGNSVFGRDTDDSNLRFSNVGAHNFRHIKASNDKLTEDLFPYLNILNNKSIKVVRGQIPSGSDPNLDSSTHMDIDYPYLSSSSAYLNLFKNTDTSGSKIIRVYRGDGTETSSIQISSQGHILAEEFRVGSNSTRIYRGTSLPKSNYSLGSLFLKTDGIDPGLYVKSYPGEEGWRKVLNDPSEEVEEVTTSDATDESSTQSLVNELKAKVNELLSAMKDSGQMED